MFFRPSRTLTDGAGGFLPGVPLGCLGMGGPRSCSEAPALLEAVSGGKGRGRVRLVSQTASRWNPTPAIAARSWAELPPSGVWRTLVMVCARILNQSCEQSSIYNLLQAYETPR